MGKCRHEQVEDHDYRPAVSVKGVRCAACHAVMTANARGTAFLRKKRVRFILPIPLERKYWKEFISTSPDPMSYEARMRGYDNIHMVRR